MEPAGGYAGLVSVGQQAFIGLGAYIVLFLALHGGSAVPGRAARGVGCALVALPVSLLLFRLRGGYFAIATWVVADTFQLVVSRSQTLGGGTGAARRAVGRSIRPPCSWLHVLGGARGCRRWRSAATYLLLRGRLGLGADRDPRQRGGRPQPGRAGVRAKRTVYLVAAAGCGAAGGAARSASSTSSRYPPSA